MPIPDHALITWRSQFETPTPVGAIGQGDRPHNLPLLLPEMHLKGAWPRTGQAEFAIARISISGSHCGGQMANERLLRRPLRVPARIRLEAPVEPGTVKWKPRQWASAIGLQIGELEPSAE